MQTRQCIYAIVLFIEVKVAKELGTLGLYLTPVEPQETISAKSTLTQRSLASLSYV